MTEELTLDERVRKELVSLRDHEGITQERVNDLSIIPQLPGVLAEVARVGPPAPSRHVAAYRAIRCGARFLPDRRLSTILLYTLNVVGLEIWLRERRKFLLHIVPVGPDHLRTLERRAYTELASLLTTTSGSPCPRDMDPSDEDWWSAESWKPPALPPIELELPRESLRRLLLAFAAETEPKIADQISEAVLDRLPKLKAYLAVEHADETADRYTNDLQDLVERIVRLEPPTRLPLPGKFTFLSSSERYQVTLSAYQVLRLVFSGNRPIDEWHLLSDLAGWRDRNPKWFEDSFEDYLAARTEATEYMYQLLKQYEDEDRWSAIYP